MDTEDIINVGNLSRNDKEYKITHCHSDKLIDLQYVFWKMSGLIFKIFIQNFAREVPLGYYI